MKEDIDTVSSLVAENGGYVVATEGIVACIGEGLASGDLGIDDIVTFSLTAIGRSSSNIEGAALVSGVSPAIDILRLLYMLMSSGSELKSVSTVNWLDSRLSFPRRKALGFARNMCASSDSCVAKECLGECEGEEREIERWDAVSASEPRSKS